MKGDILMKQTSKTKIVITVVALTLLIVVALVAITSKKAVPTWQEQYDLGMRCLSEGNYQEAMIAFTAAIEIDPKRPEAYLKSAEADEAMGDTEAAKDILRVGLLAVKDGSELEERLRELEPAPEPTPEPLPESTPESLAPPPAPEPVPESLAPEPVPEPTPEPLPESAPESLAPPPAPEPVPESPAPEPVPEPVPEPEPEEPPADALAQIVNTTQRRYPVIYLDGLEDACDQVLELTDTADADPFAQLAACYDFLVAQMNSGSHPGIDYTMSDDDVSFLLDLDDYESQQAEYFCAVGFSDWEGDCVVYAGMFYTMAKHIGFDARMIRGNTPAAGGGRTMHKWVEIDFGGQTYVFDAYLGANFARRGLIADPRAFFATTYDAHPGRFLDREVYPRSPVYRE